MNSFLYWYFVFSCSVNLTLCHLCSIPFFPLSFRLLTSFFLRYDDTQLISRANFVCMAFLE
ncbi:hypothetical protein KDA_65460 [Dictyobacter alpinus]|uniref:Uncharacterized protein n=1 Tax=Dictyobacter alpinus TaxID=2014873 RepID=A0A402BIK3_9CHLR|nr:hypothetical protein KDA_65460 [Dictyobacter alpinus]